MPLLATWCESDELFGKSAHLCAHLLGMADGGALAFFQFADPQDQAEFGPSMPQTPFHHIALAVDPRNPGRYRGAHREGRASSRRIPTCSSTATAARCTSWIPMG